MTLIANVGSPTWHSLDQSLGWHPSSSIGNTEFLSKFPGIALEQAFAVPESRFRGEMKLIC